MSLYADSQAILGLATRTQSATTNGINIGEYLSGTLFIYVASRTTPSRLLPAWQESPNGNVATGGHYITMRAYGTAIQATGLSVMTLPMLGDYGRVNFTIGGTGAGVKFAAYLVGKGSY